MTSTVDFPINYFPDPERFAALGLGSLYVGVINGNPATVVADRVQVFLSRQNDTDLAISQPISLSAGGVPLYNGVPATLKVNGQYSIAVLDSLGSQVYYSPKAGETDQRLADIEANIVVIEADITAIEAALAQRVSVVANFSALATTAATAGQKVQLFQHSHSGLGGGLFQAFTGSVSTIDGIQANSATVNVYWRREVRSPVQSVWFGAYNDGTNPAITTTAVLAARNYANSNSKHVYDPAGTYAINAPLPVYHQNKYTGDGRDVTIFSAHTTFAGAALLQSVESVSGIWLGYFSISDVGVKNDSGLFTFRGIELEGAVWEWDLTNVKITGFGLAGLFLDRAYRGVVNNIGIYSCGQGGSEQALLLTSTTVGDRCSDIKFIVGNIQDTPAGIFAIKIDGGTAISFDETVLQSNGRGILLAGTDSVTGKLYCEDLDRELVTNLKGTVPCSNTRLQLICARATYTNPVLLEGDIDTILDGCTCSTPVAFVTKNANSKRSQILNSPNLAYSTGQSAGRIFQIDDDFYGGALDPVTWALAVSGTGAGAIQALSGGVYRLSTGATSGSTASITNGVSPLIQMAENPVFEVRCRLNLFTNVTFRPITLESGAQYVRVYANSGATATNVVLEVNNGAASFDIADLVIDTNYHTYRVVCITGKVQLYIDGVFAAEVATNVPTIPLIFTSYVSNSAAADNQVDIDYVRMHKDII